jgi:hypothetical protein
VYVWLCSAVSYLVVGLDVQLDLFAGQGADSVGLCQRMVDAGRVVGGVCVLDLHVGEAVCEVWWGVEEE